MECPKCGHRQEAGGAECAACGIIFAKFQAVRARAKSRGPALSGDLASLLAARFLIIEQRARHWWEILFNWEQRNEYAVRDPMGAKVGSILEQGEGLLSALVRIFAGSHRPLDVTVLNTQGSLLLRLQRPFFWFFSSLNVQTPDGALQGHVLRRFGVIHKRYDLCDKSGQVFAVVKSPFWRIWGFPILDSRGQKVGEISKKWSGLGREVFTDADNFKVDFGVPEWTAAERAVLFAAALSIDFDFFENNHER